MSDYSISLSRVQHIIDRVHDRYPLISKADIVIIVKAFFDCMRSIVFSGDSISINNMFSNMHLYHYNKIRKNKFLRVVKVKLSTAKRLKK